MTKTHFLYILYTRFALSVSIVLLLNSCRKTETQLSSAAEITNYSLTDMQTVNLDPSAMPARIMVTLKDSIFDASHLIANFTLSPGAQAKIGNVGQVSGTTTNNFETDIDYVVTAANHSDSKKWTVTVTNNPYSYPWGLGRLLEKSEASNRTYDWYIDQGNTYPYPTVNCGPSSVTMAIKWADSLSSKTAHDARSAYEPAGGWWYTSDINSYLHDNSITNAIISLSDNADETAQVLTKALDEEQIIIVCVDMDYVASASNDYYRVGKFYSTTPNWGHFFVIKGYEKVDDELYFQVYDPYTFGILNPDDGIPKGQNRFYTSEDIFKATHNWWNYAFVVAKKGAAIQANTLIRAVDPTRIIHKFGNN